MSICDWLKYSGDKDQPKWRSKNYEAVDLDTAILRWPRRLMSISSTFSSIRTFLPNFILCLGLCNTKKWNSQIAVARSFTVTNLKWVPHTALKPLYIETRVQSRAVSQVNMSSMHPADSLACEKHKSWRAFKKIQQEKTDLSIIHSFQPAMRDQTQNTLWLSLQVDSTRAWVSHLLGATISFEAVEDSADEETLVLSLDVTFCLEKRFSQEK